VFCAVLKASPFVDCPLIPTNLISGLQKDAKQKKKGKRACRIVFSYRRFFSYGITYHYRLLYIKFIILSIFFIDLYETSRVQWTAFEKRAIGAIVSFFRLFISREKPESSHGHDLAVTLFRSASMSIKRD